MSPSETSTGEAVVSSAAEAARDTRLDARSWRLVRDTLVVSGVLLGVAVALIGTWLIREVIVWLIAAVFLAWSLDPLASWAARRLGGRRGAGIGLTVLALFGFFVAVAFIFIPPIIDGARGLKEELPTYIDRLQESGASQELGTEDALDNVEGSIDGLSGIFDRAGDALGTIGALAGGIFAGFMILVLTIYFLSYGREIIGGIESRLQPARRERFHRIGFKIYEANRSYWYGNFFISLIAGVWAYVALSLLDIPFAAPLAFFIAITDLIPNIGATIGIVAAALVAAFEGWEQMLAIIVILFIYQQLENVVLAPRVYKKAVDIHPFVTLVATLTGGLLFGVVGALIAIPVVSAVQIVIRGTRGTEDDSAEQHEALEVASSAALPDVSPAPE